MKWTFAVLSVLAILSVRKAVPSSLENLFEEIMNMKRNEVSAQAPSCKNIQNLIGYKLCYKLKSISIHFSAYI